jgi:hypothetical protein
MKKQIRQWPKGRIKIYGAENRRIGYSIDRGRVRTLLERIEVSKKRTQLILHGKRLPPSARGSV